MRNRDELDNDLYPGVHDPKATFFVRSSRQRMKRPTDSSENDLIRSILRSLSLRTVLYLRPELRASWGMTLAARQVAFFHVVTRGRCWLDVDGQKGYWRLQAGDVVI